jgi:hypothetical protein
MIELCLHGKYAFKENVYSIVFGWIIYQNNL